MKVGVTYSSFDLLNINHVEILKNARKQCDYLIVCLKLEPSLNQLNRNKNSQSIIEKYIQLKESKNVDEIVPYVLKEDIDDLLRSFKIDICIVNEKNTDFIGKKYCLKKGIEIYNNFL